eukprot:2611083-Amphidinium_carterae.1
MSLLDTPKDLYTTSPGSFCVWTFRVQSLHHRHAPLKTEETATNTGTLQCTRIACGVPVQLGIACQGQGVDSSSQLASIG